MLLFALLGKLQIREEDALVLFSSLSMILPRKLNDATSQSIVFLLVALAVSSTSSNSNKPSTARP